ncbi:hypothetical protein [Streptomyces chrestomyceticus]|uniref:hypothetical protein n=1 Tax=Streptomyces chrestomyceticus TaxID=68185 RepID=UPI0033FBFF03
MQHGVVIIQGNGPTLVLAHGAGAAALGNYGLVLDDLARITVPTLAVSPTGDHMVLPTAPAAWRTAPPAPCSPNCPARATS